MLFYTCIFHTDKDLLCRFAPQKTVTALCNQNYLPKPIGLERRGHKA